MFIQLLLFTMAVLATHFLTRLYMIKKHHQQYIPDTNKQLQSKMQLRQIQTHLFIAKILITYLVGCILILVSRF